MSALRPGEREQLADCFPNASVVDTAAGTLLVTIPNAPLPPGWSTSAVTVWFAVPVGYPAAQPDCFWTDPDLRLTTGSLPANSAPQMLPMVGVQALWFSWHLTAWRPSYDSVTTYARFVSRRFDDPR